MKSNVGRDMYLAHTEWNVPICESQAEWTPLQKRFLKLAHDEYGPSKSDIPNS